MVLINILISIFGILIFLFIFWKRLKDDYASEIIFRSAFNILLSVGVASLLSFKFFPTWFLWAQFLGCIAGLGISYWQLNIRLYETLEAQTIAFLPWIAFIFLKDSVAGSNLASFIGFLAILIVIFIYYYFDSHYKNFTWYKSGKIGFAGLATLAFVFVIRSVLALTGISVLSFVGKYEAIVSGVSAFISFLLIYNLSRESK
ncbi:MAG TPA: hypothetical protein VFI61_02600 [Patescibacteria group bacterium]|nr:hypothetical protein [Patescibacteria group bacterium]